MSGDPALDWMGRAAGEVLSRTLDGAMDGPVLSSGAVERAGVSLGPRPPSAPGISVERSRALLAGANRLIEGYIEGSGNQIRLRATIELIPSGKSQNPQVVTGTRPLPALLEMARRYSPRAKPYLTSNEPALRLYASALTATPADATTDLEKSVAADAGFGPAWLALVNLTRARGDRAQTEALIARAQAGKIDKLTRSTLELEAATLEGNRAQGIQALRSMVEQSPGDAGLLRGLAEAENAAGDFRGAAGDWKKLTDLVPGDISAWNSLGYARAWAGDDAGAKAALAQYARLRPAEANPLDSMGDVSYLAGRFADAANQYLAGNAKDPRFLNGGELYKAAWAKFRAGDRAGADQLMAQFRAARQKFGDASSPLVEADWLYRTGRQKDAEKLLRQAVATANSPQLRANGAAQLVLWDLMKQNRAQAVRDAAEAGTAGSATLSMARFAALPSASADEWKVRADRMIQGPENIRRLAVGYALILDGKREAARMVWEELARREPATDFLTGAIAAKLAGKPSPHELLPDPGNLNPFAGLADVI